MVRFSQPQVASVGAQKPGHQAGIGVYGRGHHGQQFGHVALLPANKVPLGLTHGEGLVGVKEGRAAVVFVAQG